MPGPEQTKARSSNRPPRAPRVAPRKRRLAWAIGGALALGAIIVGANLLLQKGKRERLAREDAEYVAAPVMSVEELVKAWRADSSAFDGRYKGHALAVEGVIARVEAVDGAFDSGTNRVVFLRGPDTLEIACWFGEAEAGPVAAWKPDSRVALVGRWSGEGNGAQEVVLRFCRPR